MKTSSVDIINKHGLHARPAAKLAETANLFESAITVHCRDKTINAKSIMQVMMLAAGQGQTITINAEGPDENEALEALQKLVLDGFNEE